MATPVNLLMAYNIRRLRDAKGVTLKVLAENAGFAQVRIELLERGYIDDEQDLRMVDAVIEALGCRPAELLAEVEAVGT